MKFRQAINCCERVLEAAKLGYTNSILNKGKSGILSLLNGFEKLFSSSDEAKLIAEIFSRNSKFDESGIISPALLSKANLKMEKFQVGLEIHI